MVPADGGWGRSNQGALSPAQLRANGATKTTIISSYFNEGRRYSVTLNHVSTALKLAPGILEYPIIKGIPIERVNTHSLRSGGANTLALTGYSDTQIQKMGRWRGATFKNMSGTS